MLAWLTFTIHMRRQTLKYEYELMIPGPTRYQPPAQYWTTILIIYFNFNNFNASLPDVHCHYSGKLQRTETKDGKHVVHINISNVPVYLYDKKYAQFLKQRNFHYLKKFDCGVRNSDNYENRENRVLWNLLKRKWW